MKFTKHSSTTRHVVRAYTATTVQLGERLVQGSCLFNATELLEHWTPRHAHELTLEHLLPALAWEPEIILLGTGSKQTFPAQAVMAAVMARGVGLEVMDVGAVCRTYNVLASEERRVVAALIF